MVLEIKVIFPYKDPPTRQEKAPITQDGVGVRKPGHPRKVVPPLANQKSIVTFFSEGVQGDKNSSKH